MKIVLNPELERHDISWWPQLELPVIGAPCDTGFERNRDGSSKENDSITTTIAYDLPGNVHCGSLRRAISIAYMMHLEISISPDMVWFGLMCEVSKIVKSNIEWHRHLFSRSPERIEICVPSFDPEDLLNAVRDLVPQDIDTFVPKFSTTTASSKSSIIASFVDMIEPYYGISIFTCGIRAVNILGEREDWEKLLRLWQQVTPLLHPEHAEFYDNSTTVIVRMLAHMNEHPSADDISFWKDIYRSEICDPKAYGWSKDLLNNRAGISEHFARIKFKHNGCDIIQMHGMMTASLRDGVVTPEFGFHRLQSTPKAD